MMGSALQLEHWTTLQQGFKPLETKQKRHFKISSLKMGNVEMEPTKPESNGVTKTTDSSGKTDPLLVQVNIFFFNFKVYVTFSYVTFSYTS